MSLVFKNIFKIEIITNKNRNTIHRCNVKNIGYRLLLLQNKFNSKLVIVVIEAIVVKADSVVKIFCPKQRPKDYVFVPVFGRQLNLNQTYVRKFIFLFLL